MSTPAVDRRVKRTKRMLIAGLTELMAKKSVNEISVRELAELVDINRGTFYLHYRDIFDMVEQIQQEVFDEFYQRIKKHSPKELGWNPLPLIEDIFEFVSDNGDLFFVMLGPNGDMAFVERMKLLIKEKCFRDWPEILDLRTTDKFDYYYAFIVGGSIELVYNWLSEGRKESAREMASLVTSMIISGLGIIKQR